MPPLFAHDPLDAVQHAAHRGWLLAPATALSVACEYWVLALLAVAAYAWLEQDVRSVLRAFVPLGLALALGVAIVALGGRAGVLAGWGVRAVPSAHALWGATFAAYTLRVYGVRPGLVAMLLPVLGGISRIYLGSNGIPSVVAGWVIGALVGVLAFEVGRRVFPRVPGRTPQRAESSDERGVWRDGTP